MPLLRLLAFNSYQIAVELKALISFSKFKRMQREKLGLPIKFNKASTVDDITYNIYYLCVEEYVEILIKRNPVYK